MNYEEKSALARTGDFSKEAAALRLRAARNAAGLGQAELGKAAKITKAAISNSENAQSYPGRSVMIYLYREHRIDLNFMICGEFAQLPGDVQDRLFAALEDEASALDQAQN
ncbi:helix-turn-helix domain-containing protein [Salipiger abyssi]|uniref:helix-turn-helix domain-containing protein n=1 Tax=Salipiger abyssi TaxID=1250539 RepID=UPI000977335A|nr:helix-turn-helix domain-containing protein [Salipiger abyssi]